MGPPLQLNSHPQALLSHRSREVTVSLRATGLVLKAIPAGDTEGEELGMQSEEMGEMRGEETGRLLGDREAKIGGVAVGRGRIWAGPHLGRAVAWGRGGVGIS